MKKLFATLLAATMVAGATVSAFGMTPIASVKNSQNIAVGRASTEAQDDYTLADNAFDEDGRVLRAGARIGGGDKIYYPIIATDGVIKDATPGTTNNFLTYASEAEDLRVNLKDTHGGKYIKGASIVRKDLGFGTTAPSAAVFTYTASDFGVKAQPADPTGFTISSFVPGTNGSKATIIFTQDVAADLVTAPELDGYTGEVTTPGTAGGTQAVIKYTANEVGVKTDEPTLTGYTGSSFVDGTAGTPSTFTLTATETGKKNAPTINGYTPVPTSAGSNAGTQIGKVYCVEVVLGDYFGTEQTELEYEIELREKSSRQYFTKDDTDAIKPATYFNLGEDAKEAPIGEEVKSGVDMFVRNGKKTTVKFRNGELTLGINEETGAINLSQAKEANNTVKDVEKIFLEGKDFEYEVKASDEGSEFLKVTTEANKKVVVSNPDAKMTFLNFPGKPEFDFTGTLKYTVEDPDVNYYFYEIIDNKPVKTSAKYNKEEERFELRTRTLGSYVISDKELEAAEDPSKDTDKPADKPATETPVNPTTPGKNVPTGAIA